MTSVAATRTAELLAELPAVSEKRERDPRDYGRDTLCIDSLQTGRYATGTLLIGQRLYHRVTTQPGTLRGSKTLRDFGLDLPAYIGTVTNNRSLEASVGPRVEQEMRKDPEVLSVVVTVTATETTNHQITWEIACDVRSAAGPFQLVIGVDEGLTASLLKLEDSGSS